ncbi:hypothetical protein SRS16P2_00003 (plasmid) [Variovorax sp. SRS16]|uniref:hypothetical protein n=1 Tax=Variovorax sp. SRS16 TaxID=282217 RepID=UPI00131794C8|nr:hypothetical protein [Variovorax sp. SRS16]VTU45100.1 hypothetical protein SRS16P2_00003 [Variovorax sp. SRS16]
MDSSLDCDLPQAIATQATNAVQLRHLLHGGEVRQRYSSLPRGSTGQAPDGNELRWNSPDGKKLAMMKADRKGRVTLSIGQPLDLARREELGRLIDAFLKGSVRAGTASSH